MTRTIFSISSAIAFLISIALGVRDFTKVFGAKRLSDDKIDVWMSEFIGRGYSTLDLQPVGFGTISVPFLPLQLWLLLVIVIAVRFYLHAETIDNHQVFCSAESRAWKVVRALWVFPALVMPALMSLFPPDESPRLLLGSVTASLLVMYVSMVAWMHFNKDQWLTYQPDSKLKNDRVKSTLMLADIFPLGLLFLSVVMILAAPFSLAAGLFLFALSTCAVAVGVACFVCFQHALSPWRAFFLVVAVIAAFSVIFQLVAAFYVSR